MTYENDEDEDIIRKPFISSKDAMNELKRDIEKYSYNGIVEKCFKISSYILVISFIVLIFSVFLYLYIENTERIERNNNFGTGLYQSQNCS